MDEEQRRQRDMQMEVTRREMARKSLDTIRVYNPLEIKFVFKFDGRPFSVAPKSSKDFPRYLASLYFKKISDYIIGQQMLEQGEKLKELREKQFGKSYLNKYEENIEVWDRTPRLDDPELIKVVRDTVILGLVEEYGYDEIEEQQTPTKPVDFRPMHDQLFSEVEKRIVDSPEGPTMPLKKTLASEVTTDE